MSHNNDMARVFFLSLPCSSGVLIIVARHTLTPTTTLEANDMTMGHKHRMCHRDTRSSCPRARGTCDSSTASGISLGSDYLHLIGRVVVRDCSVWYRDMC